MSDGSGNGNGNGELFSEKVRKKLFAASSSSSLSDVQEQKHKRQEITKRNPENEVENDGSELRKNGVKLRGGESKSMALNISVNAAKLNNVNNICKNNDNSYSPVSDVLNNGGRPHQQQHFAAIGSSRRIFRTDSECSTTSLSRQDSIAEGGKQQHQQHQSPYHSVIGSPVGHFSPVAPSTPLVSPQKSQHQHQQHAQPFSVAKHAMLNKNQSATDLTQYLNPDMLLRRRASLHQNAFDPAMKKIRQKEAYKTAMCQAWLEGKTCIFGDQCNFAHGEDELQPLPANRMNPKYKTRICENYTTTGICPFGNRCFFIHPQSNAKMEDLHEYQEEAMYRQPHGGGGSGVASPSRGGYGGTPQMQRRLVGGNKSKQFRKLESCGNFFTQYQLQQLQMQQQREQQEQLVRQMEQSFYDNFPPLSAAVARNTADQMGNSSNSRRASKNTSVTGSMPLIHANSASDLNFQPFAVGSPVTNKRNEKNPLDKSLEARRLTFRKMQSQKSFSSSDVWYQNQGPKQMQLLEMEDMGSGMVKKHSNRKADGDSDSSGPHTPPGFYQQRPGGIYDSQQNMSKWSSMSSTAPGPAHPTQIWPGLDAAEQQKVPSFSLFGPSELVGSGGDLLRLGSGLGLSSGGGTGTSGGVAGGKKSPISDFEGVLMGRRSSHTPYLDEGENTQDFLNVVLDQGMMGHQGKGQQKGRSAEFLLEGRGLTNASGASDLLALDPSAQWQMGAHSTGALNTEAFAPWQSQFGPPEGPQTPRAPPTMLVQQARTAQAQAQQHNSGQIGGQGQGQIGGQGHGQMGAQGQGIMGQGQGLLGQFWGTGAVLGGGGLGPVHGGGHGGSHQFPLAYLQQQHGLNEYQQQQQQQLMATVAATYMGASTGVLPSATDYGIALSAAALNAVTTAAYQQQQQALTGSLTSIGAAGRPSAFMPIREHQEQLFQHHVLEQQHQQQQSQYSSNSSVHTNSLADELVRHGSSGSLDVMRQIWASSSPEMEKANEQKQQQQKVPLWSQLDPAAQEEKQQKMVQIPSKLDFLSAGIVVRRSAALERVLSQSKPAAESALSRNDTLTDEKEAGTEEARGTDQDVNQKQQQQLQRMDSLMANQLSDSLSKLNCHEEFPVLGQAASGYHQQMTGQSGAQAWAKHAMKKAFLRQKSHSSPAISRSASLAEKESTQQQQQQ